MKTIAPLFCMALLLAAPLAQAAETDHKDHNPQANSAPKPYTYKTPKLNRSQIDALLKKPSEVLFVDVRRPDEISKIGSFPVYLNVQLKELDAAVPFIPKERSIVTISNHANRAGAAGDALAEKGFKVLGAVGSQNYEEEGGTITRIAPPPAKQ